MQNLVCMNWFKLHSNLSSCWCLFCAPAGSAGKRRCVDTHFWMYKVIFIYYETPGLCFCWWSSTAPNEGGEGCILIHKFEGINWCFLSILTSEYVRKEEIVRNPAPNLQTWVYLCNARQVWGVSSWSDDLCPLLIPVFETMMGVFMTKLRCFSS